MTSHSQKTCSANLAKPGVTTPLCNGGERDVTAFCDVQYRFRWTLLYSYYAGSVKTSSIFYLEIALVDYAVHLGISETHDHGRQSTPPS